MYIPVDMLLLLLGESCNDRAVALADSDCWIRSKSRCFSLRGALVLPAAKEGEEAAAAEAVAPFSPGSPAEPVEPVVSMKGDGTSPNELSLAASRLLNKREMKLGDVITDRSAVGEER